MSGIVPLQEKDRRTWLELLTEAFISAQGSLEKRLQVKNEIMAMIRDLGVSWEKFCEWFRASVRKFERRERQILESTLPFCGMSPWRDC